MSESNLNTLDFAFVVDTTGSMSGLITAARQRMVAIAEELARASAVDLRLGIVEYRDHPPQDPMLTRVHAFTGDLERVTATINALQATGGGAPGDGFPHGCPCGETIESVTAAAEDQRVTLYAIGLSAGLEPSFGMLSRFTGGEFFAGGYDVAMERLREILSDEFAHLDFDRRVWAAWSDEGDRSIDALAERLDSSRGAVSTALSRLGARELLYVHS